VSEAELKQFLSEHSGWLSVNDNGEISIRKPQEPKWKSFGVDSKTGKLTGGRVEYGDGDGDRDRDGRTPLEQWSVRPLTLNR
jgi:hypothetical protein